MDIRSLAREDIEGLYHAHMTNDFPAAERKPLEVLFSLYDRGLYPCYGLFDGEELVAYAFFVMSEGGSMPLLDYFAVVDGRRSGGYGSIFLEKLRETCKGYQGILLEVERVSAAQNEEERQIRERRIAFYLRAGCRMTDIHPTVLDVRFDVMYLACNGDRDDEALKGALDGIYHTLFEDRYDRAVRYDEG